MESLIDSEKAITSRMTASEVAMRFAKRLADTAASMRIPLEGPGKELAEYDQYLVSKAADIIKILEVEQWRQREAIKLFLASRLDRDALRRVSETWNNDPVGRSALKESKG